MHAVSSTRPPAASPNHRRPKNHYERSSTTARITNGKPSLWQLVRLSRDPIVHSIIPVPHYTHQRLVYACVCAQGPKKTRKSFIFSSHLLAIRRAAAEISRAQGKLYISGTCQARAGRELIMKRQSLRTASLFFLGLGGGGGGGGGGKCARGETSNG